MRVRAGSVTDPYSAERLVKSNAAEVLCLGARVLGDEVAKVLVDHFMASTFQGGDSARKVGKLEAMDGRFPSGAAANLSNSGRDAVPGGAVMKREE